MRKRNLRLISFVIFGAGVGSDIIIVVCLNI